MAETEKPKTPAELAADKKALLDELAKLIGTKWTDGEATATIIGVQPDKMLGAKVAHAFLVNKGNPFRSDYIFCDDFKQQFNIEVKG